MAIFVDSTRVGGLNTGTDWANAFLAMLSAVDSAIDNDTIFASSNHVEIFGVDTTYAFPGDPGSIVTVICVDSTGDPVQPTLPAQTASITCTATNFNFTGNVIWASVNISADKYLNLADSGHCVQRFNRCAISFGVSSNGFIAIGNTSGLTTEVYFNNVSVSMLHVSASFIFYRGRFEWSGGRIDPSGVSPSRLLAHYPSRLSSVLLRGVDLTHATGELYSGLDHSRVAVIGCLISPQLTLEPPVEAGVISMTSCDTGNEYYRQHAANRLGVITDESGIVLSATYNGTDKFSFQVDATNETVKARVAFEARIAVIDAIDFGADKTFKVNLVRDGIATPFNNDEVWIKVQYLDSQNNALTVSKSNAAALLSVPLPLPTNTEPWLGLSATNSRMHSEVTVLSTEAATGPIEITLRFAPGVADTVFCCPDIVIT